LAEAQKEAGNIIKNAEDKIISMIDEHEITKGAHGKAEEVIVNAQNNAKEIRLGTLQYADQVLEALENRINKLLEEIIRRQKRT